MPFDSMLASVSPWTLSSWTMSTNDPPGPTATETTMPPAVSRTEIDARLPFEMLLTSILSP